MFKAVIIAPTAPGKDEIVDTKHFASARLAYYWARSEARRWLDPLNAKISGMPRRMVMFQVTGRDARPHRQWVWKYVCSDFVSQAERKLRCRSPECLNAPLGRSLTEAAASSRSTGGRVDASSSATGR